MTEFSRRQLDVILDQTAERKQVVRLREVLALVAQAADSLSRAHQQGIVHGRLSPGCLLIERLAQPDEPGGFPFRVQLTGLDLDGFLSDELPLSDQVELLPYLAPEHCAGAPLLQQDADHRCDIYALGAILYRLATGHPPYTFASMNEAVRAHSAHQNPPPPLEIRPGLPATVAAIIHKAMDRQPEKRFQAADQLAYALRQAAALLTDAIEKNFAPAEKKVSLLSLLPTAGMDSGKANGQPAETPPLLRSSAPPPPYAPNAILIAGEGKAPRTVKLTGPVVTIGRSPDNDIILDGPDISRRHARLEWTGDKWQVIDLGSANGTRLATSALLPNGAQTWPSSLSLHVGSYSLHWLQTTLHDRRPATGDSPRSPVPGPRSPVSGLFSQAP